MQKILPHMPLAARLRERKKLGWKYFAHREFFAGAFFPLDTFTPL
jgi:hypothetical protein